MEDFNLGAIMSGIVATFICSVFSYLFFSKRRVKKQKQKQKLQLDDSEVGGDIDQTIENDENNIESEQVIDINSTIVDGGITQKSIDKKKH